MPAITEARTSFLESIVSPADLKGLGMEDLKNLAAEIRQETITAVNKTGGHLASNLGIVEITLALHYVFDTPDDTILWDVGHQAYIHKMLTGRRRDFEALRQYKGLSGFINPLESDHDAFIAGHSSTSISLAVGMAIARDRLEKNNKVIALIGDGGLTGGMALEAINHLGHIQKNVIIVLNDNEMSISENLGGFSQYMKRIKETFFYKDIKKKLDEIELKLDDAHLNPRLLNMIASVRKQAKERVNSPGIVFEKLGINYTGPVDGHDVAATIEALESVKDRSGPQLVHLITQKGKGYKPAEEDAIKYHGISAFSLEKVEPPQPAKPKSKTYSQVFTEALIDLAEIEPNMVAITPATAEGSGLVQFGKAYPDRFFDVAICEQHAVTMAAGMAKAGLKPVVSIYSTFLQRAVDQIIHDVSILNLPVIFGIDRGGLVQDGETHQGVFDISFLRAIPNFTVLAPKDTRELRNMLYTALKHPSGPVAVRFPRDKAIRAGEKHPFELMEFGKWETISRGKDVVLLAYGAMVKTALEALPQLKERGINPTVINARSSKPLDLEITDSILNNPELRIITLEEGYRAGGFGSAVLERASQLKFENPGRSLAAVACLGIEDHFVEHGDRSMLLDINRLSTAQVVELVTRYAKPVV